MIDTINGRTPEDIKNGLELIGCNDIEEFLKAADKGIDYDCHEAVAKDALAYIHQLEERNSKLEYTLLGVMHSVDKWLNVEPYDFDKDDGTVAATRASNAREIALKAIEKAQADLAQVHKEKDALMIDLQTAIYRGRSFNLDCEFCKDKEKPICEDCHWEWRGICEENAVENNE